MTPCTSSWRLAPEAAVFDWILVMKILRSGVRSQVIKLLGHTRPWHDSPTEDPALSHENGMVKIDRSREA
jgi:hypothetical protein